MYRLLLIFILLVNWHTGLFSQELKNRYIEVYGEENTGRFFLKTNEGNPGITGDNNINILNGDETPFTSFITVLIDGKPYKIDKKSSFAKKINKTNNTLEMEVKLPFNIRLVQIIKIIKNSYTGRKDAILVDFKIKNLDRNAHNVKLRFVADTDFDKKRNFIYQLIDGKKINSETDFKRTVPSLIKLIDNYKNPALRVFFNFKETYSIKPYRLIIAGYNKFKASKFEFVSTPGSSFAAGSSKIDSAIGVYYDFGRLIPYKTMIARFSTGIHVKEISRVTNFSVTFSAPNKIKKPPLNLTLVFQNTGRRRFKIVKAIMNFPRFFRYARNINRIQSVVNLDPGKQKVFTWSFKYPKTTFKRIKISIVIKAYDEDMKLKLKKIEKNILLTAGRDVIERTDIVTDAQVGALLDKLVLIKQNERLVVEELSELDFLINKINTATDINAYIAGRRTINKSIISVVKKRLALLIYKIKKRKKMMRALIRSVN